MNFKIGKKKISQDGKCFIVAEMSGNHNGNFKKAVKIMKMAKLAGADAIKLQTYKADTITLNSNKKDFKIKNQSPWKKKKTYWDLYQKASTPWDWHKKLFQIVKKIKIEIFSSPFDETAVDFLESLNCKAYKLASPEINHIPLIQKIAQTRKPIIISTGLSNFNDLNLAVKTIKKFHNKIAILKCTSSYPAKYEELNLKTMTEIKKNFNSIIGFSDHTKDEIAALTSVALGGKILEKHFNLKKTKSVDDFFSMDYENFKTMVIKIRQIEKIMGKISYSPSKSSKIHYAGRRSIYVSKNIKKGEKISKKNIKVVRPNYGLHPKFYYDMIGKKAKKSLSIGTRFKKSYAR